jgi:hypothetical protein
MGQRSQDSLIKPITHPEADDDYYQSIPTVKKLVLVGPGFVLTQQTI